MFKGSLFSNGGDSHVDSVKHGIDSSIYVHEFLDFLGDIGGKPFFIKHKGKRYRIVSDDISYDKLVLYGEEIDDGVVALGTDDLVKVLKSNVSLPLFVELGGKMLGLEDYKSDFVVSADISDGFSGIDDSGDDDIDVEDVGVVDFNVSDFIDDVDDVEI